jgi:hypothetical protein
MASRILLDESVGAASPPLATTGGEKPPAGSQLLEADWEGPASEPLMLYVAEEPHVGLEFSYHGLNWRIVDYRDGWVATLLVD